MKRLSILLLLAVLCLPSSVQADLNEMQMAVIEQKYDQAKTLGLSLLSSDPVSSQAQEVKYLLGVSYLNLSEYRSARDMFNEVIKNNSSDNLRDRALLGLFNGYYLAQEYKSALKEINRLQKTSPQSEFLSLIYLKQARVNLRLANWQRAKDYLNLIVKEFPTSMEFHTASQLLEEEQYYAVQVGAFVERQRAQELVEELKNDNHYAYVVETMNKDDQKFYRVRVGQSAKLSAANKLKNRLSSQGYPTQIYP